MPRYCLFGATVILAGLAMATAPTRAAEPTPPEVFERRIAPIFKSPNPSSCVQCHLAGVDLKDSLRPSPDEVPDRWELGCEPVEDAVERTLGERVSEEAGPQAPRTR